MTIQYHDLTGALMNDGNFPAFITKFEEFVKGIYDDASDNHIATIGIGTNVRDVKANLALVLKELGVLTTIPGENDEDRYIRYSAIIAKYRFIIQQHPLTRDANANPVPGTSQSEKALQTELNDTLAKDLQALGKPVVEFVLKESQAINVLRQIVLGFEIAPDTEPADGYNGTFLHTTGKAEDLDAKLVAFGIVDALGKPAISRDTKEYMALLSLQFNTKAGPTDLIGNGLKTALKNGNRAEAWFEIRYNSNTNSLAATPPSNAKGFAKRRFYESEIFSLYDSNDSAKDNDEAIQAYRMYTKNRDKILDYEAKYGYLNGNMIAEANSVGGYGLAGTPNEVHTLQAELLSSATRLMEKYIPNEADRLIDSLNIQVASDTNLILTGEDTNTRTGSNWDLLIGSYTQSNFLYGRAGNDTLIGGSKGDDKMYGGAGNDTYIINPGDGTDTIEDKEGTNWVILNGKIIDLLIKKADGTYVSPDGAFTAVMQGQNDLCITVLATGQEVILNKDFQEGDFGINFIDELTTPEETGINKHGDLEPVVFKDEYDNPYYKYDSYGNIIVHQNQAAPGRTDSLNGSSANDHLFGDYGGDGLQGKAGDDILEGGSGNDALCGDEGNDMLIGGTGSDRLTGGTGNDQLFGEEKKDLAVLFQEGESGTGTGNIGDYLYGGDGEDQLFGGAGDDILSGDKGDDLLVGGKGSDKLYGGTENDELHGGAGDDLLKGDDGDDLLIGGLGSDRLFGGAGADQLVAETLALDGETGIGTGVRGDLLGDEEGDDLLFGGAGNDVMMGGAGADTIYGGAGDDTIEGDYGITSALAGYTSADWSVVRTVTSTDDITLYTRDYLRTYWEKAAVEKQGADTIFAGAGNDWVFSQGGDDYIDTGIGDDVVFAGAGNDTIFGRDGNDMLDGDEGYIPDGAQGDDYINGGETTYNC